MVRVPCCEKLGVKKGPWTPEEDHKLVSYIQSHGHTSWRALPKQAGLSRCGKSCRLRWTNYLRPGIKRGNFTAQEENSIIQLHAVLGNRWSTISTHLPGRTDNEIKNHWNTRLRKRMLKMGLDPATHRPWALPHSHVQPALPFQPSQVNTLLLSLLQSSGAGAPSAPDPAQSALLNALLLGSHSFPNNNGLFPAAPGPNLQNNPTAPLPPPASSAFPAPAILDPALLAAAETRLVLDCLKFNNAGNQAAGTSDHHLNHLLTRLLLLKLLQGSTSSQVAPATANVAAASFEDRISLHNNIQHAAGARISGPISAEHFLQNQGFVNGLMQATNNREGSTAAGPSSPSALVANPNYCASLSETNHSSTTANMTLLNMFSSSSYQQRLLQTLPFLAESVIEPSASAASADHLSSTSSHQLSQGSFPNCSAELTGPNGSLPSQQTAPWQGCSTQTGIQLAQLSAGSGLMQKHSLAGEINQMLASGGQLLGQPGGMHDMAAGKAPTLMTWEEHLMGSEQKGGGDRDLASSSTVSSSTLSSGSQGQPTPNTPTNNFNIQEYWSNLLNLISSSK